MPADLDALEKLPGVGHKTASVVVSQAFGVPAFPVDTHIHRLAQRWKLPPSVVHLLAEQHPATFAAPKVTQADLLPLAESVKAFPLNFTGPRPIAEVISSAGGVSWEAIGTDLQSQAHPGLYLCGEMLDWEAPTGGFLLQGCMSTATWVAHALTGYLDK